MLPAYMPYVEKVLEKMPQASRDTYLRYFAALPSAIGTAYKPTTVADGYMKSGTNAHLSPRRIVLNCPSIAKHLTMTEVDALVTRIYEVAEDAVLEGHTGTVPDEFLEERLEDLLGSVTERGSTTTDKPINQWRATILTDPTVTARMEVRAAEAVQLVEAQGAQRNAKRAKKDLKDTGIKVVNCSASTLSGCNHFASKSDADNPVSGWTHCRSKGCTKVFCPDCSTSYGVLHAERH